MWEFPKPMGPSVDKIIGPLLQGQPSGGAPIHRNCHVISMRINSKKCVITFKDI